MSDEEYGEKKLVENVSDGKKVVRIRRLIERKMVDIS